MGCLVEQRVLKHILDKKLPKYGSQRERLFVTCSRKGDSNAITSFYGSSCANNGKDALNTPDQKGG
eukprot:1186148-Prorocentrum_minimum.AAC.1